MKSFTVQKVFWSALLLLFISWHPYDPLQTVTDLDLKGPVKTLISSVRNGAQRNIVVHEFGRNGKLQKARFYGWSEMEVQWSDSLSWDKYLSHIEEHEEKQLNSGPIDSLEWKRIRYRYNERGNWTEKKGLLRTQAGKFVTSHRTVRRFNAHGDLIKKVQYDHDSTGVLRDSSIEKWDYRRTKTSEYREKVVLQTSGDTLMDHYRIRIYLDEKGRVKKKVEKWLEKSPDPGFKTVEKFRFRKNGDTTRTIYRVYGNKNDEGPDRERIRRFRYNNDGMRTSERIEQYEWISEDSKRMEKRRINYVYEGSLLMDRVVKWKSWWAKAPSQDTIISEKQYQYNESGDLLRVIDRMGRDTIQYGYRYDKYGNWTFRRKELPRGGSVEKKRIVQYY